MIESTIINSINSDEELDKAIAVLDGLIDKDDRSKEDNDYMDRLGDLIEKYEDEHWDWKDGFI
jgi:HTH-type transcriptional regulator / antitoxin HigA